MSSSKFVSSFVLATLMAAPFVGCGGEGETTTPGATPTAAAPTPTATPTAAPTPTATAIPPFDKWQAFTNFAIAAENNGLDYDDNGSKDNGLYNAFEIMNETIIDNVNQTIDDLTDFPNTTDACEANDACVFTPATNATAKAAAAQAINQLVSVETFNTALATPYEAGAQPQAFNLVEEGSSHGLYYYNGAAVTGGWTPDNQIGAQSGELKTSGASTFEGTFEFATTIGGVGPNSDGTEVGFQIYDAMSSITYNASGVSNALTGGGIKIVALTDLVESLLVALDEAGVLPEDFDIASVVDRVETGLTDNSDITCDGGPCFSVTFEYDAEATSVVN